jgi:transcriptional regulator with XRE-family HTH domain
MDEPPVVGKWLRDRRKATGKTQAELAAEIGVGARSILRWEKGDNLEYVMTTMRLLSALGVSLDPEGALPASVSAELAALRQDLDALRQSVAEALDFRAVRAALDALAEARGAAGRAHESAQALAGPPTQERIATAPTPQ